MPARHWVQISAVLQVLLLAAHTTAQTISTSTEPNYPKALGLSWLFYEGQQSGELPCWNRDAWWNVGGWRVSAHLDDGKDIGKDLTGGFYDAGDYLKVTLPLGFTISTLAWGVSEFAETYKAMDQYDVARNNIKWGTDWLIKAHIAASDDPAGNQLVAQVGDPATDHAYWWKPQDAPAGFCRSVLVVDKKNPAADVAGATAAALAAASTLFADDADYQGQLLKHAKQLYGFAVKYPGMWKVRRGETIYNSTSYKDDIAWAAAWLCKIDSSFCKEAVLKWNDAYDKQRYLMNSDWNNVFIHATTLMLSLKTGSDSDITKYRQVLENKMLQWSDTSKACPDPAPVFKGCYSPKGLLYMTDWGNVPRVAITNFNALVYANYVLSPSMRRRYRCWARSQLRLMLGGWGQSFLVGYGTQYPTHIHNRPASCPADRCTPCTTSPYSAGAFTRSNPKNPNVHAGALVGGPNSKDVYADQVDNYQANEAALDYNAGFAGAMAAMVHYTARLPPSMTWAEYCNPDTDFDTEPLLDKPSFSGNSIPDASSVVTQQQCLKGPTGPSGLCNTTSTQAKGVPLQCTPALESGYTGSAATQAVTSSVLVALVSVVLLLCFGVHI